MICQGSYCGSQLIELRVKQVRGLLQVRAAACGDGTSKISSLDVEVTSKHSLRCGASGALPWHVKICSSNEIELH